jgi:outer membrane protein assembly factor BamD (BamD/ComL family)
MRKMEKVLRVFLPVVLCIFILSGCTSPPPVIPEDISQPEIFQRAQEQADNNRWDNALIYYRTFLERFPDDLPNVLAARYEIAFIQYKKEQYQESKKLFSELLETYKTFDNPLAVPQWPRVLAEKLLKKIEEKIIILPPGN